MLEMALMSAACSTNVLSLVTGAFPDAFNWVLNISNSGESNSPKNLFMSWLVAVAVTDAVGVAALCLNQAFTVGACGALGSFGAEGEAPEACGAIGCCEVFFLLALICERVYFDVRIYIVEESNKLIQYCRYIVLLVILLCTSEQVLTGGTTQRSGRRVLATASLDVLY